MRLIRKATSEEIDHYEHQLYPVQDVVLGEIQSDAFNLSGGTALSRYYFQHRCSDDLDLFFDGRAHAQPSFSVLFREVVERLDRVAEAVEVGMDDDWFKRCFVRQGEISLKVEFIYENYRTVGERQWQGSFSLDSRENILANKLTAIVDRKTTKDFFDLFFLMRDYTLEQAEAWARHKMVPLDYEGLMLAFGDQTSEGEIVTPLDIDEEEFLRFRVDLIQMMLDHARGAA